MAVHTGSDPVRLDDSMNPNDEETFWYSWTDKLNSDTISTSTWVLPTGFTETASTTDGSVTVGGVTYNDANSLTVTTTNTDGLYSISNEITTAAGNTWRRTFLINIDPCL